MFGLFSCYILGWYKVKDYRLNFSRNVHRYLQNGCGSTNHNVGSLNYRRVLTGQL